MVKRLGPGNGQRIDAAIPEPRCESPAARRREPPSAGGADVAGGKPLPGPDNGEGEDALAALCTEAAARGGLIPYRDSRFAENWFAMGGRQQTAFFATAVCQALPPALRDDINAHGLSILDLGCATGDALPVLHSYFPASLLAGVDVSPIAVSLARFLHPDFTFYCFDELAKSRLLPDIVYCSNTLEHVETWSGTLARLGAIARQYIVLAVPFGEYACISGHFASFGVDTLPERIGGAAQLVFQVVLDAGGEAEGAWAGRQLIVVYASAAAAERLVRLGWLAARERAAAATAERAAEYGRLLAEQHRLAAEREEANAAALAEARRAAGEARSALARSATDTGAALEAERAAAAARLAEQEQIAAAREAALHTVIAGQADRAALLAREAAEQQVAADMAAAELLWRLAQRGFFAAEREAALRARVKELAALLPRVENRWSSRRRAAIAMRRGARAFARGDWRTAAAAYRRAVDYAPGSAADWAQLGRSLACQGDHAGAAAAFDRAVAIDDSAADVHVELGRALASAGEFCAAIEALEAAGRLQPATEDVEQELAALYGRMVGEGDRARDGRDWAAAAQRYWRALDRAPGLMPIWVQLGHVLKEHGDHFGAEAAYRRALLLDGSVADTHLQLGHLLKLQGRRLQAARAYATAIRLDPDLQSAHDSLHAVLGYSPNDIARFLAAGAPPTDQPRRNGKAAIGLPGEFPSAASLPDDGDPARFGPFVADALCHIATQYNVLWLSVIDWNYRIQRPQHLAMQLAAAGSRVFYISITFDEEPDAGAFRIVGSPHAGVFEVRLRVRSGPGSNLYTGLGPAVVEDLQAALDALIDAMSVRTPIVIVDHPAWHPVAFGIAGATVVYDCLDLATGFSNVAQSLEQAERALIGGADLVVAASAPLGEHIARMRSSVVIRNAADVDFFARGDRGATANKRPVIGYFGAIAEWFDIAWIEECAVARPGWEFRLIGRTDGCDISRAAALPNVRFCGERRYDELPELLGAFDVAVIPFKMTELIRCTNPVKFYEYMAAGKPVVSAPLPEVVGATELAYVADDASSFEARIAQALDEDCPALRERRRAWARQHSWTSRADALAAAIDATLPPVSVIVLSYNNWALTERCLLSIRNLSDYPTLEILVVDNASTDATRQKLGEMAEQDRRIRVILNQRNLGFAAGNNVGLKAARGEYAILINNDTIVTRGWVRDLIRPMQIDPRIGLVGPLTNRIGNEQRVAISYNDLPEMASAARRLVRRRLRQRCEARVLAFFCVALRRAMLDELGLLDETYGLGFFEDDDYCMRAARGGWKMVIADDVFVHHHHSAAFDALGETATEQMARNRRMFESRWGPWQPHQYRRAPGFGDAGSAPAD